MMMSNSVLRKLCFCVRMRRVRKMLSTIVYVSAVGLVFLFFSSHTEKVTIVEPHTYTTECPRNAFIPFSEFRYPIEANMRDIVQSYRNVSSNVSNVLKPINTFQFTFRRFPKHICRFTEHVFLLYLIKSTSENFERRQTIRDTWTNVLYFEDTIIRHVFLLAMSDNITTKAALELEILTYRDILQMSFLDHYYNNTYKTTGAIHWAVKMCPNAKFVVLVDDDFYVATDSLISYLQTNVTEDMLPTLYTGKVCDYCQPQRYPPTAKWYTSVLDYPFDSFPLFIHAGFIIMSMEFVKDMQIAIQFTKHFTFDDVFLAIVAYKLGVHPIPHSKVFLYQYNYLDDTFEDVMASHFNEHTSDIRLAWRHHISRRRINESITRLGIT